MDRTLPYERKEIYFKAIPIVPATHLLNSVSGRKLTGLPQRRGGAVWIMALPNPFLVVGYKNSLVGGKNTACGGEECCV
jgi:hypothetical protein